MGDSSKRSWAIRRIKHIAVRVLVMDDGYICMIMLRYEGGRWWPHSARGDSRLTEQVGVA